MGERPLREQEEAKPDSWTWLTVAGNFRIMVDREDRDHVLKLRWHKSVRRCGGLRILASVSTPAGSRKVTLARWILRSKKAGKVGLLRPEAAHDYRKSNLGFVSVAELAQRLPKRRAPATSLYRGVSRSGNFWRATIQVKGRSLNLGTFEKERDAALAYDVAARQHFGENCFQNLLRP